MKKVSVAEAKAQLSGLLEDVADGVAVVITRHNVPVAEIRPVRQPSSRPRPFGLARGTFVVPDDFDTPVPGDLLDASEGQTGR